jgi:hypothetical protein
LVFRLVPLGTALPKSQNSKSSSMTEPYMNDFEKMMQVVQPSDMGYAPGVRGSRPKRRHKRTTVARMRICRCGVMFEPKAWQVKHHHDKLCPSCSPKDPRWSSAYTSQRSIRMLKAGYKCEECSTTRRLQCHHVNGDPYDHSLTNLKILCKSCHQHYTNGQRADRSTAANPKRTKAKQRSSRSMRLT